MLVALLAGVLWAAPPEAALARLAAHTRAWEAFRAHGTRTWQLTTELEKRDGDGDVAGRDTEVFTAVRVEERAFYRRVLHNGLAPTDAERRKEAHEEADFARATRQARARGAAPPDDEDHIRIDEAFLQRYEITMLPPAERDGRPCLVFQFRGRRDGGMTLRPQEIVLRRLVGRAWVDAADGGLVHLEAALPEPVRIGLVAARVERLTIRYDQQRLEDGVWAPLFLEVDIKGRALVRRFDETHVYRWAFDPLSIP